MSSKLQETSEKMNNFTNVSGDSNTLILASDKTKHNKYRKLEYYQLTVVIHICRMLYCTLVE